MNRNRYRLITFLLFLILFNSVNIFSQDKVNAGILTYCDNQGEIKIFMGLDKGRFWNDFTETYSDTDRNDPLMTALREFMEETRGVFDISLLWDSVKRQIQLFHQMQHTVT
jgi:hypothetical protein